LSPAAILSASVDSDSALPVRGNVDGLPIAGIVVSYLDARDHLMLIAIPAILPRKHLLAKHNFDRAAFDDDVTATVAHENLLLKLRLCEGLLLDTNARNYSISSQQHTITPLR
jgi:hypothetical protein